MCGSCKELKRLGCRLVVRVVTDCTIASIWGWVNISWTFLVLVLSISIFKWAAGSLLTALVCVIPFLVYPISCCFDRQGM